MGKGSQFLSIDGNEIFRGGGGRRLNVFSLIAIETHFNILCKSHAIGVNKDCASEENVRSKLPFPHRPNPAIEPHPFIEDNFSKLSCV